MLLQIMEDGHLSDAKGHKVDFRNTIILMTSNVGAEVISRSTSLGFGKMRETAQNEAEAYNDMKEKVLSELKHTFRPEFLNRVDGVLVFHALTREQIKEIVDLEVAKVRDRLGEHGMRLRLTEAAREYMANKGYDPTLGARPLRRVVQSEIEDALSEGVLAGRFAKDEGIVIDLEDDQLVFHPDQVSEVPESGEEPQVLEVVLT
jgi:ATP-dependent Clp protease ATP-binding subunit ClpC